MTAGIRRRSFIKTAYAAAIGMGSVSPVFGSLIRYGKSEMILAEKGKVKVPIVLPDEARDATRRAAVDLADYIGKVIGARPEILTGSGTVPGSGIWIGTHAGMSKIYPGLDTDFSRQEEILIACNGQHLVIAGRDRFFRGTQIEYGTANAVYEFLERFLNVRWFWPGELGEDIIPGDAIVLPSFEYRFNPLFLGRQKVFRSSGRLAATDDWTRYQRLKLDSLKGPTGDHAFTDWWERFHEDHPEWFALQPDGTRGGYPDARTVKMCLSNPEVWDQWLADVEEDIGKNPALNMLNAHENDNHSSGICVCKNCRAWDHPQGEKWTYRYKGGHTEEYVAMSDRYITFWNQLARKLKERFPDRNDLYVRGGNYGPTTPIPVKAVPDENVLISYTGKFPTIDEGTRSQQKQQVRLWSETAPNFLYRPNLWYWTGGVWGLPDTTLRNVLEDFRFIAQNRCRGLFIDTAFEHWCTQGPQYYLIARLAWDPLQDGQSVLEEYYRRGFGKAAGAIRAYWDHMEEGFHTVTASEGFGPHGSYRYRLLEIFEEVYTKNFLDRAADLIREAERQVAESPEKYRRRVGFVGAGLELTRLMVENIPLMTRVRESGGKDRKALRKVAGNWEAIKKLDEEHGPFAINYRNLLGKMQGRGYQGNMQDYFGPPSEQFLQAKGMKAGRKDSEEPDDID
jgi:hypothetical protein